MPPAFDIALLDGLALTAIQQQLRDGVFTVEQLVAGYLARIAETRVLNAYVEVFAEEALAQARVLDARLHSSQAGRLFGCVLSIKDNICYAGHHATAGSKILEGFIAPYSATAVERVLAEDAIIIGRTNCDAFGMGSSNENSVYGPVRNAADPERVSGGSSGGAAVAVQTRTCLVALGSDTGGSVRQPASFCGVWGLKPTYGRVSRHGLIAYGSSFDQIGIIGQHPADLAAVLEVIAGPDEYDAMTAASPGPSTTRLINSPGTPLPARPGHPGGQRDTREQPSPVRIAYLPAVLDHPGLDAGVRRRAADYLDTLTSRGHTVEPVEFDLLDYVLPTYYVLTTAEASANLARYDGVRYGLRAPGARNLEETYVRTRSEGFSDEVKRRILLGTFVLSSGFHDAYYTKAQQVRRLIRQRLLAIFEAYDFIALPTAPAPAWRFGEKSADPLAMYLADIYTVLANLAGVPALAFPVAPHPDNGLPVGMQLMAAPGEEARLLSFGGAPSAQG